MDVKEETSSGVSVRGDGAPQGFYIAPRPDNPVAHHQGGAPSVGGGAPSMVFPGVKKKMGRPRKYNPDGSPTAALSPMPISASIPLAGDLPGWKQPRARGFQALKKAPKPEIENLGDRLACLVGANFTPHVITVQAGEDVAMKILSVSQQESRAICVLSASGSISNVTLRQPNSSGGTLTYEGRFEILSLSGSFMPTDNGIMKSRSGGMSVSLAGPDGRVFGGGLAGLLVAATPIQVVLGSFLAGQQQQENKPKKARMESVAPVIPAVINPVPGGGYGIQKLNSTSTSTSPPTPSFQPPMNSTQFHRALEGDNNNASSDGDSDSDDFDDGDDGSPLNLEISG